MTPDLAACRALADGADAFVKNPQPFTPFGTIAQLIAALRSLCDRVEASEATHAAQLAQVRAEAVNGAAEAVREFREQVLEMCAASSRLATKVNDMGGYRVARSLYLDISVLASMPLRGEAGEEAR